jgi:ribosomal protein S18 acetylase RimI-like enzyme
MRHLIEQIINNPIDIIYESGEPLQYRDEFSKLWLEHMSYLKEIERFPYNIEFDERIFFESLNNFKSKHKYTKLFVAKESSKMIGFLQAGIAHNGVYGFISDLHVLEQYRNRYIGEDLVNNCLEWFSDHNIKECDIEVTGGNERVLEFYKKYDFDIATYTLKKVF